MSAARFAMLADAVLIVHFLFVVFVVVGFVAILVGKWRGWSWVCNRWFRNAHLASIGIVVLQAWLGQRCPLTSWETALRIRAGQAGYSETFIQHWLHQVLFFDAPTWVFGLTYTVFGALVFLVWWLDRRLLRGG